MYTWRLRKNKCHGNKIPSKLINRMWHGWYVMKVWKLERRVKIIDEKAVEQEENNYHGTSGKEQNNLQNASLRIKEGNNNIVLIIKNHRI